MDVRSIDRTGGRIRVNHLKLTVVRRRKPQFAPQRFQAERFRPIRTRPFQLQVAHTAQTHVEGMGFATIIGRSRFSPRQQMNAAWDDGRFPFYPRP